MDAKLLFNGLKECGKIFGINYVNSLLDDRSINTTSEMLRVTHILRLSIIQFIDNEQEMKANKIYRTLDLDQSITSQYIKIL